MAGDDGVNIPAYIGVIYPCLGFICFTIVFYYAEPGFPWHSYITLTIGQFWQSIMALTLTFLQRISGYYVTFGILLLVPIDIAACVVDRRSPGSYSADIKALSIAYTVFFDSILVMGSVVLVFEEYYNTDGMIL